MTEMQGLLNQIFDPTTRALRITGAYTSSAGTYATAGTDVLTSKVTGDTQNRFVLNADGSQEFGGGAGAADVTVSRLAAALYGTTANFAAREGNAARVAIGSHGPAGEAAIVLGSGLDATLYRAGAGILASTSFAVVSVGANEAAIGAVGPASQGGVQFGTARDTNLYRSAADTLKTDDALAVVGALTTVATPTFRTGTVPAAGGTVFLQLGQNPDFAIVLGTGAPTASAPKGSLYIRTDATTTTTRMYINTNGSTTWTNFTTAA